MAYKTVNLKPRTYDRLQEYKVAGRSFDDVVNELLDRVDLTEFYADALEVHRRRRGEMSEGSGLSLRELEAALDE